MKKKAPAKTAPQSAAPKPGAPRTIAFTSQRCFRLAQVGWEWAIASLPLDLILVALIGEHPTELSPDAVSILILLLLIAATGTLREQIFTLISNFRALQMKIQKHHVKYFLIALGVLAAAEVVARGLSKPIGAPIAMLAVGAIVVIASAAQSFRRIQKAGEKFLSDRLAQVEQANTLHLTVIGVPLAAARATSLVVAFQTLDLTTAALGSLTSLILILALHPVQSDFMAPCRSCQRLTSRVLRAEGFCPSCSPEKFR